MHRSARDDQWRGSLPHLRAKGSRAWLLGLALGLAGCHEHDDGPGAPDAAAPDAAVAPDGGARDAASEDANPAGSDGASPAGDDGGAPPAPGTQRLAVGYAHSCAVTGAGAVKCWGDNYVGQLGDGTKADSASPVAVTGLGGGIVSVVAGGQYSCALTSLGAVKCWGLNRGGQLGDGTDVDRAAPVDVAGLSSGVSQIVAGWAHACALTRLGAVKCWGENYDGELGDGTSTGRPRPVDVPGLGAGVAQLAAGGSNTCALTTGGAVKCWGSNEVGQVGDGGDASDRRSPSDVSGLSAGVAQIAFGSVHGCALRRDGAVRCWGHNTYGQLGDGKDKNSPVPVEAKNIPAGVTRIALGSHNSWLLTATAGLLAWGYNQAGQLGDGSKENRTTPVAPLGLSSGVLQVAPGGRHSCALRADGTVRCWGWNEDGQLGDGTTMQRLAPVAVPGL